MRNDMDTKDEKVCTTQAGSECSAGLGADAGSDGARAIRRIRLIVEMKRAAMATDQLQSQPPTNEQLAILELANRIDEIRALIVA